MRALIFLLVLVASGALHAQPVAVATIAPVHSLVAGVMEGVGQPRLLVPEGASPHNFALRPSDRRTLGEADVIFWLGPELETFLERPLATLPGTIRRVQLLALPDLIRLDARSGGGWEAHQHAHGEGNHHGHGHSHAHQHKHAAHHHTTDPHIWLDPRNAAVIVRAVADTLATLDPANRETYESNRDRLLGRLETLEQRLAARLDGVGSAPFIVFHDAYYYFEQRFALNAVGSITVDPERRPGARRLRDIRQTLQTTEARCVFSEPQFTPALVEVVLEGSTARHAVLDPLGADLAPGASLYFDMMENLATQLHDCLQP